MAATSEPMRLAAADAFASWTQVLADRAVGAGIDQRAASALAAELLCMTEGALLLGLAWSATASRCG